VTEEEQFDWDAPLNADGPGRTDALHRTLGLSAPALSSFRADLHASISSKDWGFAQLADLTDVDQRALVSDQFLSAIDGLVDALVDAAINGRDVNVHTGPTGLPYPDAADSLNDMLRYERLRASVAGFFDAVGTALDCLAAILIVVARVPLSVQRADFTQLSRLDPAKARSAAFAKPVPEHQRDLWQQLVAELDVPPDTGPSDWLNWSLEMRNALTHRGRVTNVYLPRRISGRIAVPPTRMPQSLYRYDLHLRSRPWLPAIEGMLAGTNLPASWLDEPAGRTTAGLFSELVKYTERVVRWANDCWTDPVQQSLVPPARRWVLPPPPQLQFAGINPGGTTPIAGAIGGINEEHIRLAEQLRRRRAGLPDVGASEEPR
jgi:hypothetical protein